MTTKQERINDSDVDEEHAEAPVARGSAKAKHAPGGPGVDIPLALPAQRGDLVTIEYAEDADIRRAGETETFVFLGTRYETVMFTTEEMFDSAVEDADDPEWVDIHGKTTEGAFRFNERLLKHAKRVTVERKETPDVISVQ